MRPHFRPPPVVQKRVGDESDESDESDDTEIWSLEKPSSTKKEKEITSEKEERDQKEPFGEKKRGPPPPPKGRIQRLKDQWNEKITPKWNKVKQVCTELYLILEPYLRYGKFSAEQIELEPLWKRYMGHPYVMAALCSVYTGIGALRFKSFSHPVAGLIFTYQYLRAGEQLQFGDPKGFKISAYTDTGIFLWSYLASFFNVDPIFGKHIRIPKVPTYLWCLCLPSFVYHWNRMQEPPFYYVRNTWREYKEYRRKLDEEMQKRQQEILAGKSSEAQSEKLEEPKELWKRKLRDVRVWWKRVTGQNVEQELKPEEEEQKLESQSEDLERGKF